jgi:uncharacterized protein
MELTAGELKVRDETRRFFQKVYGWMFFGLLLSGGTAYFTAMTPALFQVIYGNKFLFWGLVIAEFGLVFSITWFIKKISANFAKFLFVLYCVLTGLTLSVIFLIFTIKSIGMTFFIAAIMFGSMSVYGFFTRSDLTGIGRILFMGLWGIIIASVVNIFLMRNSIVDVVISILGVVIFTGLTAYDVQKIKKSVTIGKEGTEEDTKNSILGALELYLDFINIFLNLLRLFGRRK